MRHALTIILLACAGVGAQAAAAAKAGPGSRLWIEGDSTLHKWESHATVVDAAASIEAPSFQAGLASQAPAKLTLTVPVESMKSEHEGLDKNLRKALKAKKFPDVVFTMSGYKADPKAGTVAAQGELTVAGVTKAETITAAYKNEGDKLVLDGQQPLLMTDFGVKPPTAMMGTIKSDNRLTVKFHLELEPSGGR